MAFALISASLLLVGLCGFSLVSGQMWDSGQWCDHGVVDGGLCVCEPGFTGYDCDKPQCNCWHGGDCEVVDGRPTCICPDGYTGRQCEHVPCSLQCENGGTCMQEYRQYFGGYDKFVLYCRCPEYYIGPLCSIRHTNSPKCPRTSSNTTRDCVSNCGVGGCNEDEMCCKEGCSTMCRCCNPGTCYHNNTWYQQGDLFMIECNNCTCKGGGYASCTKIECPPREDFDNLPRKPSAAMIGGVSAGAFIAIIVGVVLAFLCCRWRSRKAESASKCASCSPRSVRSSLNSKYAVPADVATLPPLPPYTPKAVASAPPPYSIKSDMKDSVYVSLAPPSYQDTVNVAKSYTNPEYQYLRVHMGLNNGMPMKLNTMCSMHISKTAKKTSV